MQTEAPPAHQEPIATEALTPRLPVVGKIILIYFWLSAFTIFLNVYQAEFSPNFDASHLSGVQKFALASDGVTSTYWWLALAAVFLIRDRKVTEWRVVLFTSAVLMIALEVFALIVHFEDYNPIQTSRVELFGRVAICLALAVSAMPEQSDDAVDYKEEDEDDELEMAATSETSEINETTGSSE